MELIHIANATFSSLSFKTKHSLENLASKQNLSGLLKSRRCAHRHRRNHASIRAITPAHVGTLGEAPIQTLFAAVRMSSRHHASCAAGRGAGGASRDRTGDLLVANQALSQLSYGPSSMGRNRPRAKSVVLARHAPLRWWVWEELHLRPHPSQGCALTN